jgi:hypothetical protein
MDERTWLASGDAHAMLGYLFPHDAVESVEPQSRRSRMYLIACARRAWCQLPGVCRAVVRLAEQIYGDRKTARVLRDRAYLIAETLIHCRGELSALNAIGKELVSRGLATPNEVRATAGVAPEKWVGYSHLAFYPFDLALPYFRRIPSDLHFVDLIREVFGNPFRRIPPLRDQWRTDTVMSLARQADSDADFAILPVLADALEDAGCDQEDVLDHLRHGGPHVRGCWAVEWVLTPPPRLLATVA